MGVCFYFRNNVAVMLILPSGHVWYAVDQDDMTEKVRCEMYLDSLSILRVVALPSTTTPGDSGR